MFGPYLFQTNLGTLYFYGLAACENSHPSSLPARVTPFLRKATWAGNEEGRLFSQANGLAHRRGLSNHIIALSFNSDMTGRVTITVNFVEACNLQFNRPIPIYQNSNLAPRLRGIKQKKWNQG